MLSLLRQLGYIAAAALASFYVFMVFRSPQGLPTMLEKREQLQKLEQENRTLEEEILRRRKHIDELKRSQTERDRAVRERTNKAKDNETVIYLSDPPKSEPAKSEQPAPTH